MKNMYKWKLKAGLVQFPSFGKKKTFFFGNDRISQWKAQADRPWIHRQTDQGNTDRQNRATQVDKPWKQTDRTGKHKQADLVHKHRPSDGFMFVLNQFAFWKEPFQTITYQLECLQDKKKIMIMINQQTRERTDKKTMKPFIHQSAKKQKVCQKIKHTLIKIWKSVQLKF